MRPLRSVPCLNDICYYHKQKPPLNKGKKKLFASTVYVFVQLFLVTHNTPINHTHNLLDCFSKLLPFVWDLSKSGYVCLIKKYFFLIIKWSVSFYTYEEER